MRLEVDEGLVRTRLARGGDLEAGGGEHEQALARLMKDFMEGFASCEVFATARAATRSPRLSSWIA